MEEEFFYNTNHMTVPMEHYIAQCDSFECGDDEIWTRYLAR